MGTWQLFNNRMISVPDLPAFPTINHAMFLFRSAWLPLSNSLVFAPVETVLLFRIFLMSATGANSVLAQKIYAVLPFLIAFIASYVYTRRFFRSKPVLFMISLFYSINPVTIKVFVDMSTGWLYVYSLLPFLVHLIDKSMQAESTFSRKNLQTVFLFSILFAFAFANGLHLVLFIAPFLVYYLWDIFFKGKGISQRLSKIMRLLLLIVPASLPMFISYYSQIGLMVGYVSAGASNPPPPVYFNFEGYRNPLLSIATLQTAESTGVFGWGQNWIVMVFGLVLPVLVYASIFFVRDERNKLLKSMVIFNVVLSCSVIAYTFLTHMKMLAWVINNYRFLAILSTADLPLMMLAFTYTFLLGYTLSRLGKRNFTRIIVLLMFAFAVVNWPVFTGNMGLNIARSEAKETFPVSMATFPLWFDHTFAKADNLVDNDYRTYFPEHFNDILRLIGNNGTMPYRTYWLPFVNSEIEARLQHTEADPLYMPLGMDRFIEVPLSLFLEALAAAIAGELSINRVGSLLSSLNVKYVVVNLASRSTGPIQVLYEPQVFNVQILGSPDAMVSFLGRQQDLKEIYHTSEFIIYENQEWTPRLYSYSNTLLVNSSDPLTAREKVLLQSALSAVPGLEATQSVVVYSEQLSKENLQAMLASGATTLYFDKNSSAVSSDSDDEIIAFIANFSDKTSLMLNGERYKVYVVPLQNSTVPQITLSDSILQLNRTAGSQGVFESDVLQFPNWVNFGLLPNTTELSESESGPAWGWSLENDVIDGKLVGDVAKTSDGLSFAGDGKVTVTNQSVSFSDGSFALEAWIKMDSTSDEPIFVKGTNPHYSIVVTAGKAVFSLSSTSESGEVTSEHVDSGLSINPGQWYHVVATRDAGKSIRIYVNGVYASARDSVGSVESGDALQIGSGMHGSIAQVRVYNRNLSEDEVLQHYWSANSFTTVEGTYFVLLMKEGFTSDVVNNAFGSDAISQQSTGSGSDYQIQLSTNKPTSLVLSEPYHKDWKAYYQDGSELPHFCAAGYVNGFIVNESGSFTIRVHFAGQEAKDTTTIVWSASWIFLFVGLVATSIEISSIKRLCVKVASRIRKRKSLPSETTSTEPAQTN